MHLKKRSVEVHFFESSPVCVVGVSFGVGGGAFSCAGMEGGILLLGLFPPRTQTENRGTPLSTISAGALWIGYNVLDGLVRRIAADQPHAGTRARRDVALRDRFNPSLSRPSSTRPSNALDSEPSRAVFFTFFDHTPNKTARPIHTQMRRAGKPTSFFQISRAPDRRHSCTDLSSHRRQRGLVVFARCLVRR